ncbi:MAG: CHAT domain-containing protein [Candidatus Aminicenantales bacterium]
MRNGQYPQAMESFLEALRFIEKTGDQKGRVLCLMSLGILRWNVGQMEESCEFYRNARALAQESNLKSKEEECRAAMEIYQFYSQGKEWRSSGQLQKSTACFRRAIELAIEFKSKGHELKCLRQLSLNYWETDTLEEFFSLNRQALKIAREMNHEKEVGRCLNNIGLYYWKMNDYFKALNYFEESLLIARKFRSYREEADCLTNIGVTSIDLGDYRRALIYLKNAIRIEKQNGDEEIYMNLNNIGKTFRNRGILHKDKSDFLLALKNYSNSLKIARKINDKKTEIIILNNIGVVHTDLENFHKALKYFEEGYNKSCEIQDIGSECFILNNIGRVLFFLNDLNEAVNYYKKAIEIALKTKYEQILWEAYFGLGQCYEKDGQFSLAIEYYKKSIEIIDHIRSQLCLDIYKTGFIRNKLKIYESLIDLLYRLRANGGQKKLEKEIFCVIEKAKARAFLESLLESKVNIREKMNHELQEKEMKKSSRISSLILELSRKDISDKRRRDLEVVLSQEEESDMRLASQMRGISSGTAGLVYPEPGGIEAVQTDLLDEKTALIEYFLGENRSFMFFITKNDFELHSLPPRQEIKNTIRAYLKALAAPPMGKFDGILAASRLFEELLSPLAKRKAGSLESLIVIPDGVLYYFPFETLIVDGSERPLRYLIHDYQVSYAPSSSVLFVLTEKKRRKQNPMDLLAVGDPVYKHNASFPERYGKVMNDLYANQGFELTPLPFTKKEVLRISKYFRRDKRDLYLGSRATEAAVKRISLQDYEIIHFACHGFLDEQFPLRSALILSFDRDEEEDGVLQVREIYKLRLNASLVVLSACQTGIGLLERAEGMLGLPRIFFYAGAKSVLSTLWTINDQSTAKFMRYLYHFLYQGKSKAQALRLAKLEMIHSRYSHPFHWAAFVLNGEYSSTIDFH